MTDTNPFYTEDNWEEIFEKWRVYHTQEKRRTQVWKKFNLILILLTISNFFGMAELNHLVQLHEPLYSALFYITVKWFVPVYFVYRTIRWFEEEVNERENTSSYNP